MGKMTSAKRREIMGNTWGKSCSPHKAEECPRATEFRENVRDRKSSAIRRKVRGKIQEYHLYTGGVE